MEYRDITNLFVIGIGGFLGAVCRYGTSTVIPGAGGTLVLNVLGSFLLGLLLFYSDYIGYLTPRIRIFAGIGFLGAFTTFSTFIVQTVQMQPVDGFANIMINLLPGLFAIFLARGVVIYIGGE
ncbi:fluoride efflux transporter CrcB [Methanohalophilus halophilus]|uniref:Fluoride-specific ion channel FluC n=1 Tax=Methanohalophilus halophilus TaxID=2177 RepID=A0A1L3Q218_9EURY|nr:fluoride efflux transporter CrcB [Methanohalophilus halophilus]APH38922.1 Camphor resistance CrcB protein [Methanohalophilus halophilus]RNI07451.1 fluoride efflux transporter CrcB [Methanohalophilus halophilus]SDW66598.1 camphor resistance protein CrcB [Methanohalophilus halophilus]